MKNARKVVVGVVCGILGAVAFAACGGTTSSTSPSSDSGAPDLGVQDTFTPDTFKPDVQADSATCDLSSDLTASIPDASLDDGGTRSTGLCLACANQPSTCQSDFQECDQDCDCKSAVAAVITCITKGGSEIDCGSSILGASQSVQTIGFALLECIQNDCADQCVPAQFKDGGGAEAGSDAGDDASD